MITRRANKVRVVDVVVISVRQYWSRKEYVCIAGCGGVGIYAMADEMGF